MTTPLLRLLLCLMLLPAALAAQTFQPLMLPRQELLPSNNILQIVQDREGYLWYATEGGGLCRDDGRQMLVFRSDADHPNLLGSNEVARLAEIGGRIIIGTFHGAYVLDKESYAIQQLTDVDEKRVDDIIVDRNGHLWLTANKKVYEFSSNCQLLHQYQAGDKYLSRLHQDRHGTLWATQWDGGLLRLQKGNFIQAAWSFDSAPTAILDADREGHLWIGTIGGGIVRYDTQSGTITPQPATGNAVCVDMQLADGHLWLSTTSGLQLYKAGTQLIACPLDSILPDNNRATGSLTLDLNGRVLVACNRPFVLGSKPQKAWFDGKRLTRREADSLQASRHLTAHPTAYAIAPSGQLWYSTGQGIRCHSGKDDTLILPDTKDVSAMAFTPDGRLWMATIFGNISYYKDGVITTDDYATNEHGDAVTGLYSDSNGNLLIAYDRYTRLYDISRQTLSQQNTEEPGTYRLELQESAPHKRWSQPQHEAETERTPLWLWVVLLALTLVLTGLVAYIMHLHRQRRRFDETLKRPLTEPDSSMPTSPRPQAADEWLQRAIELVEKNLADEHYSVEGLSADMCMSRMTFYRKIQTATGHKPTEFIRSIRLHHAAEMLKAGRLSVTEISYATGFSSVSYFSRCFRTMYGVPPTQFCTDLGRTTTADDFSPKEMPS